LKSCPSRTRRVHRCAVCVSTLLFKMASTVNEIVAQASENLTEYQNTTTARVPSTPEGMAIAYGSLIIMAILPIFFGSYRAVKHHKEQQVSHAFLTYVWHMHLSLFPVARIYHKDFTAILKTFAWFLMNYFLMIR